MNCNDVLRCLSEARSFSVPEEAHLETCSHCRSMMTALDEPADSLSEDRLQVMTGQVVRLLKPVRPLRSNRVLLSFGLLFFIGFCFATSSIVGFFGLQSLGLSQLVTYYSVLTGLAFLFSMVAVQDVIPGSKTLVQLPPVIALMLGLVVALPFALFHDVSLTRFVPQGLPCLRLGCLSALISGALASIFIRRGSSVSLLQTSVSVGFFAGLTGFSVLALHCPIQNAAHVAVWHGGAVLAAGLGGSIVGLMRERIS